MTNPTHSTPGSGAIAVFCGSSTGNHSAYLTAATSVGRAMAAANRPLVYGGGSFGIMGTVSGAVLESGGKVTGITPYVMVAAGGEGEKKKSQDGVSSTVQLNEAGREMVETVIVDSMHERKVEMAKRSVGFIGLPGGFGTFEEIFEVITWTQLGIHNKPVVLVNVHGFWEPLRQLVKSSVSAGFISPKSEHIIVFVDGPSDHSLHEEFDWGTATLQSLDNWQGDKLVPLFDWTKTRQGRGEDNFVGV